MFSQCYYSQNVVWENVCPTILDTHFHDLLYNFWIVARISLLPLVCDLEIKAILKKISNSRPYKSNITKEEQQALRKTQER